MNDLEIVGAQVSGVLRERLETIFGTKGTHKLVVGGLPVRFSLPA